jgi:hypothetical protein
MDIPTSEVGNWKIQTDIPTSEAGNRKIQTDIPSQKPGTGKSKRIFLRRSPEQENPNGYSFAEAWNRKIQTDIPTSEVGNRKIQTDIRPQSSRHQYRRNISLTKPNYTND